ncbi:DNA polymerase III subunit delta' [Nitrosophilus alvini]|uniref:DNA polymerase III subunit delta' n=1 Tax=Nitrosophilus alvini TaxID=2714855 RepID=UPI00190A374E|nr:DNA polymerase III subunit delta' [Nitrosophilus alvini]
MADKIELKSQIIITEDFEKIEEFFKDNIKPAFLHIFRRDEFKIDDAKDVIKEAYIASESLKYIILAAEKYNIYSQNTLLKILEEPPKNIIFIMMAKSKSSLLPTIRSRLPLKSLKSRKDDFELPLDIDRLDLAQIYSFVKENQRLERKDAKKIIELLIKKSVENNIVLNEKELEFFSKAYRLLELNASIKNVLTAVLLMLLKAKKRKK